MAWTRYRLLVWCHEFYSTPFHPLLAKRMDSTITSGHSYQSRSRCGQHGPAPLLTDSCLCSVSHLQIWSKHAQGYPVGLLKSTGWDLQSPRAVPSPTSRSTYRIADNPEPGSWEKHREKSWSEQSGCIFCDRDHQFSIKFLHKKTTIGKFPALKKPQITLTVCLLNCRLGRKGGYCNPMRILRHIRYSSNRGTQDQKHKLQTVLPAYSRSCWIVIDGVS